MNLDRAHRDGLLRRLLVEEAKQGLQWEPAAGPPVQREEIEDLPPAVRRYLAFMRVEGRPRDRSFHARFVGRFRLRGRSWMPAEAWQYSSGVEIARIFVMRLRFAGVIPMVGVDAYVRGRGWMLGKLLDVVPVVEGRGMEFDVGELVTYLNDGILLAPSFLLRPEVSWSQVADDAFDVTLEDRGRAVTGRVLLDERGAPRDFITTDRFADVPSGLVRAEWRTPISGWGLLRGRPVPGLVSAVWHLPEGPLPYVEGRFDPGTLTFDVPPSTT